MVIALSPRCKTKYAMILYFGSTLFKTCYTTNLTLRIFGPTTYKG